MAKCPECSCPPRRAFGTLYFSSAFTDDAAAMTVLSLDTPCLLLADDPNADFDERGIPLAAVSQGFPTEGLDRDMIEDTAQCARQFIDPPSDD
jgi:hypothetical protein